MPSTKKCRKCNKYTEHSNAKRCKICGYKKPKRYKNDDTSYAERMTCP